MKSKSGKTIRWISVTAALVALIAMALGVSVMADTTVVVGDSCYTHGDIIEDGSITEDDAVYLLYHSVFGEEAYPLSNYEQEEEITGLDALALLAKVGQAGTTVHAYSEPAWQWTDDGANAVFTCACGDEKLVKPASVTTTSKEATCVEPGTTLYEATVHLTDKVVYETTKSIQGAAATGVHTYESDVKCVDRTCTICEYVDLASAHEYEVVKTEAATCTSAQQITYQCKECKESEYTIEEGLAAGHAYGVAVETHVDDCEYKEVFTCGVCSDTTDGEHYFKHVETAQVTKEATCQHDGVKLYTCSKCNATHEADIASVTDAHIWNDGTTSEDETRIVYACTEAGCTATRTAINAVAKKEVKVDSSDLADTKEIDLNGTSLALDEATASQLTGEVEIKAEEKTAEELNLTDEQKEQIGDNPVYDFSITDDTGAVTNFDGSITISLPYTLQDGDDVDCIDVWYIADDGTVTIEEGTYANGYVTFTAKHFSYYTVTRLTPEQRCEKYGHNDATNIVAATCTEAGYSLKVCARCGRSEKTETDKALGHSLVTVASDATCTEAGKTVVTCDNCDYKSTTVIPATGHKWEETTETATCAEAKTVKVGCASCEAEKEIILAQLNHELETEKVAATCENKEYVKTTCKNCDYEATEYTGSALSHTYEVTWTWDKEAVTAKATFTCSRESCGNTFDKDATVTIEKELPVSCEEDGYVDYLAKVIYNAKSYTDGYTVITPATGHNTTADWQYNALQHYHECSICEGKLEAADHVMDDGVVSKEATCTEAGEIVYSCDTCAYQVKETIPAPGHNYDNGICTECGFGTAICNHDNFYLVEKEFTTADGYCGGVFSYETCDCGKVSYFCGYDFDCEFEYTGVVEKDENGYAQYDIHATCDDCGLHLDELDYWVVDDAACTGTMYMDVTVSNKAGEEIFTFSGISEEDVEHPNAVCTEPEDMSKYGMCAGTVTQLSCLCGQDEMLLLDLSCELEYVDDACGEDYSTYYCETCDTTVVNEYSTEELTQCSAHYNEKYTFYRDDEVLVSYEYSLVVDTHTCDYTFELEGENCEDGYTVHETCSVCGYENSYFEQASEGRHHDYYQTIDVSEYDLCTEEIDVWACPCGAVCSASNLHWAHDWETVEWDETENTNGYTVVGVDECIDCGLTREYTSISTQTDEPCEWYYEYTSEYSVDGKVIVTERDEYLAPNHDTQVIGYELLGESCEDGVVITYECKVCGEVESYTTHYHENFALKSYDAAEYGMCDGEIVVYGCACGEEGWISEDTDCKWEHVYYDEETGTERYECSECGIINDVITEREELEGCKVLETVVYEYIEEATVVLRIERTYTSESHDFLVSFDIEEGANCDDGFMLYMTCMDCGATRSWHEQTNEGEHYTYKVQSYDMGAYDFCEGELAIYACPCGTEEHINWWNVGCSWEWIGDFEDGARVFECCDCGALRYVYEEEGEADGCYVAYVVTNVFCTPEGEEVLRVTTEELYSDHDFAITFELEGETCSDGYTIIRTCKECNEVYTRYESTEGDEHRFYYLDTICMEDYGFCGGEINISQCPCGTYKEFEWDIHEYCDFEWIEDETTGEERCVCSECGGYYTSYWDVEEIDACHAKETGYYVFYKADGEEAFDLDYESLYNEHDDICTFELSGDSCEDGYVVTRTCQTCDSVRQYYGYEHDTYLVNQKDLAELGFCGGTVNYYSCPCGEETDVWVSTQCNWTQTEYVNETNTWVYECATCGCSKETSRTESEKDTNCMVYVTSSYKYYNADGTLVVEYDDTYTGRSHNYVYEFIMQGESCEDGYYLKNICTDCGESWQESYLYTDHQTWRTETVDLAEKGLCGGTIYHYQCACGQEDSWRSYDSDCCWNWTGMNDATCTVCGATRSGEYSEEVIDACHVKESWTYVYTKDGVEVFSYVETWNGETHDVVYTLELNNPESDCSDGYTATGVCRTCNEVVEDWGYYHGTYLVGEVDLGELGLCEDTVLQTYECACVSDNYYGYKDGAGCDWSHYWDEEEDFYSECNICGATRETETVYGEKDTNCNREVIDTYTYFTGEGVAVYSYTYTHTETAHDGELISVEMNDPTDCEQGFREIYQCKDCGTVYEEWYGWHKTNVVEEYDLSEYDICGEGYVEVYSCHCGERSGINSNFADCSYYTTYNDYKDESGIEHEVSVLRCDECDLMFKQDRVYEHDCVNCETTKTNTVTITVGDIAVIEPFVVVSTYENHDYTTSVEYWNGATNCDEGVRVTETCNDCGYSYDYITYGHVGVELARYDLTQYGSTCTGYIVHEGCPCGSYSYIGFEDLECDMDSTCLVNEVVYSQYTTQGHNAYWQTEILYKCAVTDPACAASIYRTQYHVWDEENCEMITYASWKLGYNDTDGTYADEILIETDRNAYHAYETVTSEDGNTQTQTCKYCGSTYVTRYEYDTNGNILYSEESATNTLENGENKAFSRIYEYVSYMGYSYETKYYTDYTYANGNTWFIHYDYAYDWDNFDCTAVRTMTDSYGNTEVQEYDMHRGCYEWITVEDATCSQPGLEQYVKDCPVCNERIVYQECEITPSHCWYMSYGIYTCTRCGLENTNGADGSIIFEDMTEAYGNGTDYVIGYYQRNNVKFSYELLVVLDEYEIPLTGITFAELTKDVDGITAITFNKADAEAAAIAALTAEGVTDTDGFALRFVFIPESSDGDFDYAITLTDESIAE